MRGATLFVNPGDAGVRDLTVRIVDPFGVEIARVADEPWELGPGDAVLSFDWNVGSTPPGSYAVVAELAEDGVTRARAVSGISVAAEVRVDATLLADRQRYGPHQTALLTGAVTNAGANTLMTGVTVWMAVADAGYAEWFSTTRTIDSFSPSTSSAIPPTRTTRPSPWS